MKAKNLLTIAMFLFVSLIFAQSDEDKKLIEDAVSAKKEFLNANPKLDEYFNNAKAYAIFPNIGKGAVIVGAASGHGAVYQHGKFIGIAKMKQVDIGAQLGGKAFSEVIFFETDDAVKEFLDDNFQFGSNVSAIAADKSTKSFNISYDNEVAVFTLPKEGLMAEISVGGQKFNFKRHEN